MELKKSETIKNLARAFAGECQAGARYQFLRKQAMQKQLPYVADILKLLATNEMAHAKVWFDIIVGCSRKLIENIEITAGYPYKCGNFEQRFVNEMENEKSLNFLFIASIATWRSYTTKFNLKQLANR